MSDSSDFDPDTCASQTYPGAVEDKCGEMRANAERCTSRSAEEVCCDLTECLTDVLENFFDDRWSPHCCLKHRPSYVRCQPEFENASMFGDLKEAYDHLVAAVQRLIELAVGHAVEMRSGLNHYGPKNFDGFHAALEWDYMSPDQYEAVERRGLSR